MLKPYIFHAEHWHDMALDGNHIQMTWISWPFYCADCACICAGCCFRRWCSATGLRLRLLAQIGSALPERLARCSSVAAFAVLQVKQTAVKNKDILTTSCECFLAFAGLLLYVALQCPAWVVLWVFCLNLRPASKAKKQKAWKHHEQTTTPGNHTVPPSLLLAQCQDFLRLFQLHGSDSSPMRKQ